MDSLTIFSLSVNVAPLKPLPLKYFGLDFVWFDIEINCFLLTEAKERR